MLRLEAASSQLLTSDASPCPRTKGTTKAPPHPPPWWGGPPVEREIHFPLPPQPHFLDLTPTPRPSHFLAHSRAIPPPAHPPARHIERDEGAVMQFHSFYRDIRSELTGVNGWSQNLGRYMREAEYK